MKIGIDIRPISYGSSGGVLQLLQGVLSRLFLQFPMHHFFVFSTIYNRKLLPTSLNNAENLTLPTDTFFRKVDDCNRNENLDVIFRSFPIEDDLEFPLSKQVFLVPDMQHEIFPDFFSIEDLRSRRLAFNRALCHAGAIVTLSEFTKRTILEHPWTLCSNVHIVSPALQTAHRDPSPDELSEEESALIPKEGYFYFPANLWPHKNHRNTIEAFRLFLENVKTPFSFIFTGHPEGWERLSAEFSDLPIRHLGYVTPKLVKILLQRAKALAFFSMYEGFGIPLLEAFQAGTPVICSNAASLPEVGGDAILSCDPNDVETMAGLMHRITNEADLREDLIARGKARLSQFTWEQSAANLFRAFETVSQSNIRTPPLVSSAVNDHDKPLVSIVTPSFNQGHFLRRTIDSVLQQDYPHIEYIVIDGGSTDHSREILHSYDGKIAWVSEPDRGQTHAINKGFARSKGLIRAYLNSDDILYPGAVSTVVDFFSKHADIDMVYGRAHYIDEYDRVIGFYNTDEYSFERNMNDCCVCQPACFWRKRASDIVGDFREDLHYALDYDYWLRLDRAGARIKHIQTILAASRLYGATKTLSGRNEFYREIFDVCKTNGNYVSLSYFMGFWHHRLLGNHSKFSPFVRIFPSTYKILAKIHHKTYHREYYRLNNLYRILIENLHEKLQSRFPSLLTMLAPVYRSFRSNSGKVKGFYLDNWLAPKCRFRLTESTQIYYLAGTPPKDMILTVEIENRPSVKHRLLGGHFARIEIGAIRQREAVMRLKFSKAVTDPCKRKLSFLLDDTNLFVESDLWAS